jgi:hypothetical protein
MIPGDAWGRMLVGVDWKWQGILCKLAKEWSGHHWDVWLVCFQNRMIPLVVRE